MSSSAAAMSSVSMGSMIGARGRSVRLLGKSCRVRRLAGIATGTPTVPETIRLRPRSAARASFRSLKFGPSTSGPEGSSSLSAAQIAVATPGSAGDPGALLNQAIMRTPACRFPGLVLVGLPLKRGGRLPSSLNAGSAYRLILPMRSDRRGIA